MSATKVMVTAMLVGVVGRWANNKKALPDPKGLIEVLFALGLIAFLDNGRTEPVAKGFAWLFFAAVMLSDSSPLTGLAHVQSGPAKFTLVAPTGGTPVPRTGGGGGRATAA